MKIIITLVALSLALNASAMERFVALSSIETNNNDRPPGTDLSRFGISPAVWSENCKLPQYSATNTFTALYVAKKIMAEREKHFLKIFGRKPNDFEWYVLWHKPAFIKHPDSRTAEIALRFQNLATEN